MKHLFGENWETAQAYADILATDGVARGMIGPREVPRLWDRHLWNCVVVVPRIPAGATVADVGSGAGLPGLVWAIARPDIEMTLVEPLLRRTTFLTEVVERLGLSNVTVDRSRAEDVSSVFDVVTARAVAPMDRLAGWCLPLVREGGVLLALKGRTAADEVASSRRTLMRLGATSIEVQAYGDLEVPTTVVEITR
ncbi:16S rRNA methyltransferase GidB [Aeromicrobium marinum DSM 15272]|uniref:Ribosomal RNA small subunit methyltransferase G n=1 Tax=Aeromicrobium marinum DSM 15272 TaxID=585531 RepID=E2S8Q2_9ACTN|nr:16S rRNA (guanine(527)-N(7))-methyltransferase RsmG [Aeromicrobium marinum]EFQ84557.1 16S rRNA methyltransferase GidB [Aeromicrobium marinum DSM 15272]